MTVPGPPPPPPREPAAKLSDVISLYRPTKIFKPAKSETAFTSFDFDDQGEILVAACNDETLQLYSCRDGSHRKVLYSKKYGAHLARFTHQSQSLIYASTKVDDTIRYLSTNDNQYIRYFPGHTDAVTSLAVSPSSDTFISCSLDNTVRLWSLNSANAAGKINLPTPYLAAYDASATVVAIASPGTYAILLYDLRNYDHAPFTTFDLLPFESVFNPDAVRKSSGAGPSLNPSPTRSSSSSSSSAASSSSSSSFRKEHASGRKSRNPGRWTKLEFSNCGKYLLLGTASGRGHYVLDAFTGALAAFCALEPLSSAAAAAGAAAPAPAPSASRASQYHLAQPSPRLAPGASPSPGAAPATQGQGSVCFAPDGRYIIGGTSEANLFVWDIHQAPQVQAPAPPSSSLAAPPNASTPGRFGAAGNESRNNSNDGFTNAHVTAVSDPARSAISPAHELECRSHAAVVAFNPRLNLCVSGNREVVFWVPDKWG